MFDQRFIFYNTISCCWREKHHILFFLACNIYFVRDLVSSILFQVLNFYVSWFDSSYFFHIFISKVLQFVILLAPVQIEVILVVPPKRVNQLHACASSVIACCIYLYKHTIYITIYIQYITSI